MAKICNQCNTEYDELLNACPNCHAEWTDDQSESNAEQQSQPISPETNPDDSNANTPNIPKKRPSHWIILGIAVGLALLAVLFIALRNHKTNKETFQIIGTLENGAGKMVYIEELTPEGPLFLDSIKMDSKGNFTFRYKMPYESFYNVHVSQNDYIVLLPQNGETIRLKGDYNRFSLTYSLEGSPQSTLLWQLQEYTNMGIARLTDIVKMDDENRAKYPNANDLKEARKVTDSIFLDAFAEQQDYIMDFIQKNYGSLATMIALYKEFNNHPIIDPAKSLDWYEDVLEGLETERPNNPHTIHFHNSVEYLKHKYPAGSQVVTLDIQQPSDKDVLNAISK